MGDARGAVRSAPAPSKRVAPDWTGPSAPDECGDARSHVGDEVWLIFENRGVFAAGREICGFYRLLCVWKARSFSIEEWKRIFVGVIITGHETLSQQ